MGGRHHSAASRESGRRQRVGGATFSFRPPTPPSVIDALSSPPLPREAWALKTTDTLRPGEKGTKRLAAEFGDRLVCVRYRCDPANGKRYKTVEVIVGESDWARPSGPDDPVLVQVAFGEEELRAKVKAAGGRWRPTAKAWELPLRTAEELGLLGRIVESRSSQI